MGKQTRIDRLISRFLRSEYFQSWQSEHIESGSYSRDEDRRDRFDRCYDAAEDGGDGSTHREHINDMRKAFPGWLREQRRNTRAEFPWRVQDAAAEYFNDLETWHERAGTIDQEVG